MPIRDATPADIPAIARIHVDSWRTTYRGLMPDDLLAGLSYERRERQWAQAITRSGEGRGFYEALGGVPSGEKTEMLGDTILREVAYGWPDLTKLLTRTRRT